MITKVILKKNQLDYFRSLARKNKNEIHAYLIGKEQPEKHSVIIKKFVYPKKYEIQTAYNIKWFDSEYANMVESLDGDNIIIGDIHTHPNAEAILSKEDYDGCLQEGLTVCGICSVYGNKTFVRFWNPHSALPMDIEYE